MTDLLLDIHLRLGGFRLDVEQRLSLAGITALFGPSGSGKTTLLRVIAGLERAAGGRIRFAEETWLDSRSGRFLPPHKRRAGYVFQDARLFPHLTVAGNLRYAARRAGAGERRIDFGQVVSTLDLDPLMDRRTAALSGGERQRVAIGRSLLSRPRLLLMDEPLAGLDRERKADILPYIACLPDAFGIPVIYVTHAIEEAARLARRMVVLRAGQVAAQGPVGELLERFDLDALADGSGAGVVVTARAVRHDPDYRLTHLTLAGQPVIVPRIEIAAGSEVRLRIRAGDVALALRRPQEISVRNILAGKISEIVEDRETAFAEVLVDLGGVRLRSRITRAAAAEMGLAPGLPVFALVKSIALAHPLFR